MEHEKLLALTGKSVRLVYKRQIMRTGTIEVTDRVVIFKPVGNESMTQTIPFADVVDATSLKY